MKSVTVSLCKFVVTSKATKDQYNNHHKNTSGIPVFHKMFLVEEYYVTNMTPVYLQQEIYSLQ